ncbi:MAG: M20/M25/M40 family metallo-hydrolase [Acidobacteriota bacterium]
MNRRWAGRRKRRLVIACAAVVGGFWLGQARAADIDWEKVGDEAVELLGEYIRIRSVNPPAHTVETAAFLKRILEAEGIEVKTYESEPGKVNLLARLPAAPDVSHPPRPLLLLHHMDVVPVDASRWPVEPFSGVIRDGQIYGRGAADMKEVGIIHLLTLVTLKRRHVPLGRDVLLLATADEETGGEAGARWMIENHWDELDPEYVLDEGGFGARDVLAADGKLVFAVSVAEKKIVWVKLRATGTAGHGSQPMRDNPNVLLARALAAIAARPSGPRPNAVIEELRARIGALASNKFTRAIQRDTLSVTTLRSGVGDPPKVNVIPSTAEATIDCRLLPDTDVDRFLSDLLAGLPGRDRLRLEVLYRMDQTAVTPHDTGLFSAIAKAIQREHPDAIVTPFLIPYGTDSNTFRTRGVKAYGLIPMVLDASIIASMHSDAERVPVAELGRGVRIFYNAIADFCGR